MVAGVTTAVLWRLVELHTMVYEGMPGIIAGTVVATALSQPARHWRSGGVALADER